MFWSKIWFFVIAIGAALALAIALLLPRPAERAHIATEHQRLSVACGVVNILLRDSARQRVELANAFSRSSQVVSALDEASGAASIEKDRADKLRDIAASVLKPREGTEPDIAMLIDRKGRVVTRYKVDVDEFGDVAAGRPLIDDALAGYARDDLWVIGNRLYLVAAAPVVRRDAPIAYVGAAVVGYAVTNQFAEKLTSFPTLGVSFYVAGDAMASSRPVTLDRDALVKSVDALGGELKSDCDSGKPFNMRSGSEEYTAVVARLPGEAQNQHAFYSIFVERPKALGFGGTLGAVRKNDLGFGSFPWLLVAGGLLLALIGGIGLMIFESDLPLRKLNADALQLAKGETPRLAEEAHRGKFGSIARSVNIHVDKVAREAKAAKQDLDQLLGPNPENDALAAASGLGALDILGSALPAARPGAPAPGAPPPSEFKFSAPTPVKGGGGDAPRPPIPSAAPPAPPVMRPPPATPRPAPPSVMAPAMAPPGRPGTTPGARPGLDDDILSDSAADDGGGAGGETPEETAYFHEVFDQFVALKKSCNESIAGLTYVKFAGKLRKNRDDLRSKTNCREVRFTVYVKDGKAALKASPVKED